MCWRLRVSACQSHLPRCFPWIKLTKFWSGLIDNYNTFTQKVISISQWSYFLSNMDHLMTFAHLNSIFYLESQKTNSRLQLSQNLKMFLTVH